MRTIVIGDIHGCYNELKSLISNLENNSKYNPETDRLIFLGDYIDRGDNSRLVIKFIRELQENNNNVIALMGNHEDMLLKYISGGDDIWLYNGYSKTIESYKGYSEDFKNDVEWMKTLPLYYEDDNYIYVHAGIDINKPMEEQDNYDLLWIREPFIYNVKEYHKRVVFGHTPSILLNDTKEPMPICTYNNNIGIDTGCVFTGVLTALIIEDEKVKEFYQTNKKEEEKEGVN